MKLLGILVAAFSVVVGVAAFFSHRPSLYLLVGFGLIATFTTYRAGTIGSYLKILAAIFSVEIILFGSAATLDALGLWPGLLDDFKMPLSGAITVALFSILVYVVSFVPTVRKIMKIADLYYDVTDRTTARIWPFPAFAARERTVAIMMVVFLVVINQVEVLLQLLVSFVGRDIFNALQNYDSVAFWKALGISFPILAFPYIAALIIEFVVASTLVMRWRTWLTGHYTGRWLDKHNHYNMSLVGAQADNPDQRIAEDIFQFLDPGQGGVGTYSFTITLISTLSSLVTFSILLWTLSSTFTIPGTHVVVPGFLFWCAVIYAVVGTSLIHWIGWPLSGLSFTRQRFEADFRFALARLREYGEQVALLKGEETEKAVLHKRFGAIVTNYYEIVDLRKKMTGFSQTYGQITPFIPYAVAAPFFFTKKITLGTLRQVAQAFGEVNGALTVFVNYYVYLADYISTVNRLSSFDASLTTGTTLSNAPARQITSTGKGFALRDVTVSLPDGREILSGVNLDLGVQQPVLMTGPSGSGKSTLFRTVAGIWPYTSGTIDIPQDGTVMVLPQRPYFPIGTLMTAVSYPALPGIYPAELVRSVLSDVRLAPLIDSLDIEDNWTQRLSGGEQQRLSVARAILAKPDWLLLDEATSAMDLDLEEAIYAIIAKRLPNTTIVSNAHRESLKAHHDRILDMTEVGGGRFTPRDKALAAAE